jgi:hypothetical protein
MLTSAKVNLSPGNSWAATGIAALVTAATTG